MNLTTYGKPRLSTRWMRIRTWMLPAYQRPTHLHLIGLAISGARNHSGCFGIIHEFRSRTGFNLQRAAHSVADIRKMAKIGAGHGVGNGITKVLLRT